MFTDSSFLRCAHICVNVWDQGSQTSVNIGERPIPQVSSCRSKTRHCQHLNPSSKLLEGPDLWLFLSIRDRTLTLTQRTTGLQLECSGKIWWQTKQLPAKGQFLIKLASSCFQHQPSAERKCCPYWIDQYWTIQWDSNNWDVNKLHLDLWETTVKESEAIVYLRNVRCFTSIKWHVETQNKKMQLSATEGMVSTSWIQVQNKHN